MGRKSPPTEPNRPSPSARRLGPCSRRAYSSSCHRRRANCLVARRSNPHRVTEASPTTPRSREPSASFLSIVRCCRRWECVYAVILPRAVTKARRHGRGGVGQLFRPGAQTSRRSLSRASARAAPHRSFRLTANTETTRRRFLAQRARGCGVKERKRKNENSGAALTQAQLCHVRERWSF